MRFGIAGNNARQAWAIGRKRALGEMYDLVDLTLARFSQFIPEGVYQRLERGISRRQLELLDVPPEWVAEWPDGFKPENVLDVVFAWSFPNPDRAGCFDEVELIDYAKRLRPIDDPGFTHIFACSPCYRRLRALQQLKPR